MNVTAFAKWTGTLLLLLTLGACGGSDDGAGGTGPQPAGTVIGAAGGTVTGPNGASVVIPPGALTTNTAINIAQIAASATALPAGFSVSGQMFAFTPHGTRFAVPVTLALPFDPASVPAGRSPAFYKTNSQNQWEQVINATFGTDTVTAQITSFSDLTVVIPPLERLNPVRTWTFSVFPGTGQGEDILPCFIPCKQVGGQLEKVATFGPLRTFDREIPTFIGSIPKDSLANGFVFGTADGVTYGVFAEAPSAELGGPDPIGSNTRVTQTQSFIKRSPDASLTFTVTFSSIEVFDYNSFAPTEHDDTTVTAELYLDIQAYTRTRPQNITFFRTGGSASVIGTRERWVPAAPTLATSRTTLWVPGDFDFVVALANDAFGVGTIATLEFRGPRTYTVDLSTIGVGEKFTLQSEAFAITNNRRGGGAAEDQRGSGASAFLRDPLSMGGTTLVFAGLEPTDDLEAVPPVEVPVPPAVCLPGPGPDPAAGVIQFSAASYSIGEFAGATSVVTVSRTGGSVGAVTATFTTSDGTAIGGTDYTPVNATVFFADGDTGQRVITVPTIQNQVVAPDKTVNLTLSQPGGCAALGQQTSAVLTIRDDDRPPPASLPTGIDTSFGSAGKATLDRFGGDRSGMALQADGKIVMVGGTFTDFILARFNADGSIDRSFGSAGKVTTDMGSGLRQEEALAVAIQSDGKILIVGHTAIDATPPAPDLPSTFAIARYHSDGNLDTGFGTGGRVSGSVNGIARAVAIQPDGKIVLAGDFELALSNGTFVSDFVVARFNANGSLDLPFGTSGTGQVATDIGGAANSGRNLVLQPNGAIVVSGTPQCSQPGCEHTDVVRYNANGTLDTSFGSGGKLTLADVDVGQGLVRQADGKLVLVGTVVQPVAPATARFMLMRRNADGGADTSFGTAGTASTALSENAAANGIALQADGKLVVVGTRAFSANPNFIVARYNSNGSLDTGFANAGALSIDFFGFEDVGENVLVQRDGKIVVGGLARNNVDGYGLARILP